jgi:ABC-type polar amino acid transport system ATPase subunit
MSRTILQVRDLRLRLGARQILAGVGFDVSRGELVAIMGPSGSGKTTILRAIAGLEPFDGGHIALDEVRLEARTPPSKDTLRTLRRQVGMVFQFHCLFEHLSALNNVCLAPIHAHGVPSREAERRGRELLTAFGVEHRADALPRQLSGGAASGRADGGARSRQEERSRRAAPAAARRWAHARDRDAR